MTDAKSILCEIDGCGCEFMDMVEGKVTECYCGDFDYSDNPKRHYCKNCKKENSKNVR